MKSSALVLFAAVAALSGWGASEAQAQSARRVPQAVAAVQAPESATEVCHSPTAQAALDCARKRCERKAGRGACFAVTVCQPSGWTGMMGVQVTEVHFSNTICGAPSREAVLTALRAFCAGQAGVKHCSVTHLWSPDGKLETPSISWKPGDLKR
jgi:hypothetical protein